MSILSKLGPVCGMGGQLTFNLDNDVDNESCNILHGEPVMIDVYGFKYLKLHARSTSPRYGK